MDRVILNLISLLVAGAGVFSVLTKFYVPELDMSFRGHNPFAIKEYLIDDVTTKIFVGLGFVGLVLQAVAIISDDTLPKRLHSKRFYITAFLIGLCLSCAGVWVLKNVGYHISRQIWLPKVIESQRQIFNNIKYVLEHDGWREDQLESKDKLTNSEKYRQDNYEQSEKYIYQIEKLLDMKPAVKELQTRVNNLEKYFNEQ